MHSVYLPASCSPAANTLLVMLPGAYDAPKDFLEQGFIDHIKTRQLSVDIVLLDAHIGYYTNQDIIEQLANEVIEPAKKQGYQTIWLVGISLGGYGSLLYSMRGAQGVDGIFIMAPFMGSRHLPAQIAKAGGLLKWTPELAPLTDKIGDGLASHPIDIDDELWVWLKSYSTAASPSPVIYLGYGEQDRFVASNRLLGAVLPAQQVITVDGGHTWGPWLSLWALFLDLTPWVKHAGSR